MTLTLPGAPSRTHLSEYHSQFGPGDGPNVAQIELSLLDSDSNLCTSASDNVTISLQGPGGGKLLAIESGDPDSHENYQAPVHKTFHGRLLLYIQTQGPVQLTAKARNLSATTTIGR